MTLRTIRYYTVFPCVTEKYTKHPVSQDITQSYPTLLPQAPHCIHKATKYKFHRLLCSNKHHPELPSISLYTKCSTVSPNYPSSKVTLHYTAVPHITMCYHEYTTPTQLRVTTIHTRKILQTGVG